MTTLTTLDWIVVAGYFLILLGVVIVELRRQKTATDYFLAGRNAGFFVIGASIFSTNIGSEHIVGLAGQGASTGLAVAHYELHAWIASTLEEGASKGVIELRDNPASEAVTFVASIHGAMLAARAAGDASLFWTIARTATDRLKAS